MSLGRRGFLQFCLGAGAGITFSPLPWKLMDDSAIWTQNWPWTPVPPGGEVSIEKTACTLCPGGCGITVRKVKDRAIKIEGMKGHPINDGGVCLLGMSALYKLYGGARIKGPLKRAGKRGEGKWEQISWDAAIAEISKELNQKRQDGLSHTVASMTGTDRGTVPQLFKRLLAAYGSPNVFTAPSLQDSERLALKLMQGDYASAGYDLENARYVVSFGASIIDGWGSPVRAFRAHTRWAEKAAEGAKLVQVEACLSNTAAKADTWLAIKPGTEAALALGLAHVIIKEKSYNKAFIRDYCLGFEDWQDSGGTVHKGFKQSVLKEYSPDAVSRITGVSADRISDIAREFAQAKGALAVWGRGKGTRPMAVHDIMAIHALNALVANINKPGGVTVLPDVTTVPWPSLVQDDIAKSGTKHPRVDRAGTDAFPLSESLFDQLPKLIKGGTGEYPLSVLLVHGANPYYTEHDRTAVAEALDRIPFIVSFSSRMDETANHADLILPNHTSLERYEDVPTPVSSSLPVMSLSRPVVSPQCDTRHVGDSLIAIAKSLDGSVAESFPWDDYESLLKATLGDKWSVLEKEGYWKDEGYTPADWSQAFRNASGKFEFLATTLLAGAKSAKDCLPQYSRARLKGEEFMYPLILIPCESMRLADGPVANSPLMTKTVADTVLKNDDLCVEINPKTAIAHGLTDERMALLSTPKGKAKVKIHLFDGIQPGVVAIPTGLGHTAYDDYLKGKGVNSNDLIGMIEDEASGLDIAWGSRASLTSI